MANSDSDVPDFDGVPDDFDDEAYAYDANSPPYDLPISPPVYYYPDDDEDENEGHNQDLDPNGRPYPAPKSSIDAIPNLFITCDFLESSDPEPVCPVCKDEFDLGTEVKMLPCKHIYHGECIVPWLCLSNSCPMCRSRLPTTNGDGVEDRRGRRRRRRRRVGPLVMFGNLLEEDEMNTLGVEGIWGEVRRTSYRSERVLFPIFPEFVDLAETVVEGADNEEMTMASTFE